MRIRREQSISLFAISFCASLCFYRAPSSAAAWDPLRNANLRGVLAPRPALFTHRAADRTHASRRTHRAPSSCLPCLPPFGRGALQVRALWVQGQSGRPPTGAAAHPSSSPPAHHRTHCAPRRPSYPLTPSCVPSHPPLPCLPSSLPSAATSAGQILWLLWRAS
jgi:hypothetical protein